MKTFVVLTVFAIAVVSLIEAHESAEASTHHPEARRKRHDEETATVPTPEHGQAEVIRAKRNDATTFSSIVEEEAESLAKHNSEENESAGVLKRNAEEHEASTTPIAEQLHFDKRETEETESEAESETAETEPETESDAASTAEEDEAESEVVETATEHEHTTESADESHVSRAKRVSHAGSSHKNRPSAVNRLQSNSNNNVGGNPEEDDANTEPEFDNFHTV